MNKCRDVVVALESLDVRKEAINRGLLAEGRRIANFLGGNLFALVAEPPLCSGEAWAQAAKAALANLPFRLLLFADTDRGAELAPLAARYFDSAAVTDCFEIRFRNGALRYARYVYGGQFEQEVAFAAPPEFASMCMESLEAPDKPITEPVQVDEIHIQVPGPDASKRVIRTIAPDFRTIDIRYANRILDTGAGCDSPALMEMVEELSRLLQASIGTTRVVADSGNIPRARMIGQTGKAVSPELCLTLGVSGSPHHTSGIEKSGTILSVNSDALAPIFAVSDIGFVADLNKLLPSLIERIKLYRDRGLT